MEAVIIDKVKKLLALSRSPNKHEAAQALAQALKMCRKFDIDINKIKGENSTAGITTEDLLEKLNIEPFEIGLYCGLASLFGCRIISSKTRNQSTRKIVRQKLMVCGRDRDRKAVIYLAEYLRRCLLACYRDNQEKINQHRNGLSEYMARKSYLFGAVETILNAAEDIFRTTEEASASTAIIIEKQFQIDCYLSALDIRPGKEKSISVSSALDAMGAADAKAIAIRKPVETSANRESVLGC